MSTEVVVKKSYLQVILLAMGHFFNDFYCNFLPILLPILIPKLGLSLTFKWCVSYGYVFICKCVTACFWLFYG